MNFNWPSWIYVYVYKHTKEINKHTNKSKEKNRRESQQNKNNTINIDILHCYLTFENASTAKDRLSVNCKSDLSDKTKRDFFPAVAVYVPLYGYVTLYITKRLEKKLDGNYTNILRSVLNKQMYGHLIPIADTIQFAIRHAGHCWRYNDDLISGVLLRSPTNQQTSEGCQEKANVHLLCKDTGCCL